MSTQGESVDPTGPEPAPGPLPPQDRVGFGTFSGVVRPVVLTILGAMLYLREGWLVGDLGLLGAVGVILAAFAITGTTSLSLASIASNVRVRPGGAFAIIAQALGLEAGGAIGLPLYTAQALSSAMYVYAFTEAWAYIFPTHDGRIVAGIAFAALALLAWRSADLAFKAQAVMLVVVGVALASALLGLASADTLHQPTLLPSAQGDAGLVTAFAIFFPAATGIMVGAGMSGSLADPRRAIPRGTLIAWGSTLAVYLLFALWYAVIAPPEELLANKTVMIDRALVGPLVLIGLLSSTLMASLSSLVAAPRLLQAMAQHGVVPGARWLARTTPGGEPRNAVVATTVLASMGLAAGSLDAIAPVITSFFIMTYLAINLVVYVEMLLEMISFRPAFRIRRTTPLVGIGLCLVGLSLGSPFGGIAEVVLVLGIYVALSRRQLETPWETVRSGIAVTLAAWAARRASHIERSERAWKPDLMVPVATPEQIDTMFPLVEAMARHNGSVKLVGLGPRHALDPVLPATVDRFRRLGIQASWTRLHTDQYMAGIGLTLDALRGVLFPPNLVVVDSSHVDDAEIAAYIAHCRRQQVGLALWLHHPDGGLGPPGPVAVWVSDRSPHWKLELRVQNLDLPVLLGYLLARAWTVPMHLYTVVRDQPSVPAAKAFLAGLVDQARLPADTGTHVARGDFLELVGTAPATLHLFGMPLSVELARLRRIRDAAGGSCIFLLDSGGESALA